MSTVDIMLADANGDLVIDPFNNIVGFLPPIPRSIETEWRAVGTFNTANVRYDPDFVLADADGTLVVDDDETGIGGIVKIIIARTDVTGPKSFDTLALKELVDVNYADLSTTIANGASLSSPITLDRRPILSVLIPAGWDDADMTFQVSMDGITYYELVDEDGAAVTLAVAASKMVRLTNLDQWAGYNYLKMRSGTSGTPVTQSGAVTIYLTVRDA